MPEADLQTSGLTVQPVYTGPKQLITSYQVMNNVTVTLYDLAEAGKIIDDAASAAGNAIVVNSIAFSVKDDTALLGQARAAAVRQAMGQAQVMAAAAGMSLGHLCSLVDNSSEPPPVTFASGAPGKATAPSTPVATGRGAGDGQCHRRLRARGRSPGELDAPLPGRPDRPPASALESGARRWAPPRALRARGRRDRPRHQRPPAGGRPR